MTDEAQDLSAEEILKATGAPRFGAATAGPAEDLHGHANLGLRRPFHCPCRGKFRRPRLSGKGRGTRCRRPPHPGGCREEARHGAGRAPGDRRSDTLRALGDIARDWRQRFPIPVVAITGSSGKTTTKEMVATIASARGTP